MSIRHEIAALVDAAAKAAQTAGAIPSVVAETPRSTVRRAPSTATTPPTCRCASRAPPARARWRSPRRSRSACPPHRAVGEVTAAPPGFINIRLSDAWLAEQVDTILSCGRGLRRSDDRRRARRCRSSSSAPTRRARCTSATAAGRRSATRSRACSRPPATASSGSTWSTTPARRSTVFGRHAVRALPAALRQGRRDPGGRLPRRVRDRRRAADQGRGRRQLRRRRGDARRS